MGLSRSLVQPAAQSRSSVDVLVHCFVHFCLYSLQERQLCHLSRQLLPLPGCPHREVNSNIHLELVFPYKFHLVTKMKN